jgi:hypothetical protein
MKDIPTLEERIRIYKEGSNEWEYFLTTHQIADLPPAANAFWKPLDWVNYIGGNWRRREPARKRRERSSQRSYSGSFDPVEKQDITKLSAKTRAALALKKEI